MTLKCQPAGLAVTGPGVILQSAVKKVTVLLQLLKFFFPKFNLIVITVKIPHEATYRHRTGWFRCANWSVSCALTGMLAVRFLEVPEGITREGREPWAAALAFPSPISVLPPPSCTFTYANATFYQLIQVKKNSLRSSSPV